MDIFKSYNLVTVTDFVYNIKNDHTDIPDDVKESITSQGFEESLWLSFSIHKDKNDFLEITICGEPPSVKFEDGPFDFCEINEDYLHFHVNITGMRFEKNSDLIQIIKDHLKISNFRGCLDYIIEKL